MYPQQPESYEYRYREPSTSGIGVGCITIVLLVATPVFGSLLSAQPLGLPSFTAILLTISLLAVFFIGYAAWSSVSIFFTIWRLLWLIITAFPRWVLSKVRRTKGSSGRGRTFSGRTSGVDQTPEQLEKQFVRETSAFSKVGWVVGFIVATLVATISWVLPGPSRPLAGAAVLLLIHVVWGRSLAYLARDGFMRPLSNASWDAGNGPISDTGWNSNSDSSLFGILDLLGDDDSD